MKTRILSAFILVSGFAYNQTATNEPTHSAQPPDTVSMRIGKSKIIIVSPEDDVEIIIDTVDASPKKKARDAEPKWSGLEFGFNVNTNAGGTSSFSNHPYWENDPSSSRYFNLNFFERRFSIVKEYVGITTGLGFNFSGFSIPNNYELKDSANMIFGVQGESQYSKNKLKVTYLTLPLLLQFNTNANNEKGFYWTTGVIGGVRIASKWKTEGETDGRSFELKKKGVYGLNPFKLDASLRMGYKSWGVFVNYSILSLFDAQKTVGVYPLSFGISMDV